MGCRVLRAEVDEHVLTLEIWLDTRRRLDGDGSSTVVGHERHPLRPALCVEA